MADTAYRYCLNCRALWSIDAPGTCPACDKPGQYDTTPAATCVPCGVAWHPAFSLSCWMCGSPGMHNPDVRAWEKLPHTAIIVHDGLFPAACAPVG